MNKETFFKFLPTLGFTEKAGVFSKTIGKATLAVDTMKELLIYPEDHGLKIHERTPAILPQQKTLSSLNAFTACWKKATNQTILN